MNNKLIFPLFLALCVNFLSANDFVEAGKAYRLDARILWAIAYKESRHTPHIISKPNKNGSYDIGIMQINSSHLAWLKNHGISLKDLLENPRINIYTGALILRKCFDLHGANEKGISCYNGRIQDNPYGKEVLAIVAKEQRKFKSKVIEKRIRNAILGERNTPLVQRMK